MRVLWYCALLALFIGCAEKASNPSADAGKPDWTTAEKKVLQDKIDKLEVENRSLRDELEALQEQFANVSEPAKADRVKGDGWFRLRPSSPSPTPVMGRVLFNGMPVEGATVTFAPIADSGYASVGITDAAGAYALTTFQNADGALPGRYMVTVTKTEVDEEEEMVFEDEGDEPVVRNFLPVKYSSTATSDLECEVKAGNNDIQLELTD